MGTRCRAGHASGTPLAFWRGSDRCCIRTDGEGGADITLMAFLWEFGIADFGRSRG